MSPVTRPTSWLKCRGSGSNCMAWPSIGSVAQSRCMVLRAWSASRAQHTFRPPCTGRLFQWEEWKAQGTATAFDLPGVAFVPATRGSQRPMTVLKDKLVRNIRAQEARYSHGEQRPLRGSLGTMAICGPGKCPRRHGDQLVTGAALVW